jgi:eukaryotic-like serine/threonine-protein kinase
VNSRYPSAVDYTLALQHPAAAFADASLRGATFAQGFMGPEGIAGSSAVVFRATIDTSEFALRCYTREDASTPERYAALDAYVTVSRLSRYVGTVTWFDREVLVKGARWPVLTMEWIAGRHLNDYVGALADDADTDALRSLAARWLDLVGDLQRAQFAHGDLQHGNILVDTDGQFRLVDFDSVWIPPLRGYPAPTETGHTSYQPLDAYPTTRWGQYMDTFPGLVIYLALIALAQAPELWDKFNNGDNLLFERRDFAPPHDTEIWAQLAGLADPEIDWVAAKLKQFCLPGPVVSTALRAAVKRNWWEQPGVAPPAPPGPPARGIPAPPRRFHPVHTPVVFGGTAPPRPPSGQYQRPLTVRSPASAGPAVPAEWWAREPPSATGTRTAGPVFTPATGTRVPGTRTSGPVFTPVQQSGPDYPTKPLTVRRRPPASLPQRIFGVVLVLAGLGLSAASDLFAGRPDLLAGIAVGALLVLAGVLLAVFPVAWPSRKDGRGSSAGRGRKVSHSRLLRTLREFPAGVFRSRNNSGT